MPHLYGDQTLYQSEMHMIQFVGKHEKSTVTVIAQAMDKTVSACSQMVTRLRKKKLFNQIRNSENNREYHLELTEHGWIVFNAHEEFENFCLKRTYEKVNAFSVEELRTYIKIQKKLNEAFLEDTTENLKVLE